MKNKISLLSAGLLALCLPVSAQEYAQGELPVLISMAPIAIGAGQGFRLEGAGIVRQGAAAGAPDENAPQEDEKEVRSIGGPHTQAGDIEAGDEPVEKLPAPKDVFRPAFSISAPKAKESSPIVDKAREFMARPPYNSNNSSHDWAGWCLGFVNTTLRAVRGQRDSQMSQPAAKNAYYAMANAGRISKDFSNIPAGAALLWSSCSQWGHAAIATGEMSADGTPIMITTSHKGIREMSTKQFGCGWPTGWGKI